MRAGIVTPRWWRWCAGSAGTVPAFRMASISTTPEPRAMATVPVRTSSRMPKPPSSATRESISCSVPLCSTMRLSGETSMTRPLYSSMMRRISARLWFVARTLTRASSCSTRCWSGMSWTLSTSTSRYSCLPICSTAKSSPRSVTVMRLMPGRSVWPTTSDSMLKLRARTRLDTRLRTPGRSLTKTTTTWRLTEPVPGHVARGCCLGGRCRQWIVHGCHVIRLPVPRSR